MCLIHAEITAASSQLSLPFLTTVLTS